MTRKKAADVEAAAQPAKKPIEDFKNNIKPLDDAFNKNKEEMKKAAAAVRKGDKPAAKRAIENIAQKPFGRTLAPVRSAPSSENPVEDLQKLWDKFEKAAERGDPNAMDKAIPQMEKEYQKVAEKPKDAADKLKNAIDDVVDAAKAGSPDPPIKDLKDAFDKFVKDTQADPSPEVREAARQAAEEAVPKLEDLIKKAEEAAKNPNDKKKAADVEAAGQQAKKPVEAFKNNLKPLDDAFNKNKDEMKKAAAAVRKGDRPAAKQAIEKIADKPFGRNFTPGRANPVASDPEDLKRLFDKFRKDAEKGDAQAMDRAIPLMDRAYQKLAEKPKNAADRLRKAIDDVAKAAQEGNPFPPLNPLRKAFEDFAKEVEEDPSPEVREAGALAVDEAYPLLVDLIKKSEDAAKNPADKKKAAEVHAAAQQAKKPIDAFKEKLKPLDHGWNRNKEQLKKAADEVRRGNRPNAKKIIDEIAEKPFGRNFTPGKGRGLLPPDPAGGPSDELKDLWNRFKNGAKKGDPVAMEKIVPELDKAYNDYNKATRADPLASADKLEKAIDDVMAAHDKGAPLPLKQVKDAFDNFQNEATKKDADPEVAAAAQKAAEDFKPEFAEFLKKAKDVTSNPKDKKKARAFENAVPKMKKPIKVFKAAIDPDHIDDVLINDKYGGDVKDAIADLKDAVDAQQPPQIKDALDNVKAKLADYNDNAHDVAKRLDDPGKSNYVDRKADELDDLLDQLEKMDPFSSPVQMLDAVESIPVLIDDIVCHINSDAADDVVEGAARAANLTAFLETVDEDDLDLGDLLGCATDLADLMRGMIGDTTSVAESLGSSGNRLTDAAKSALELSNLLKELEAGDSESPEAISEKVSALRAADQQSPSTPRLTLAEATTFEDITAAVAFNIKQQCEEQSATVSKTGANVATELANLSIAARKGDRQQMMLSAKAASAHIAAFSKEILALAQNIPGKNAHERSIQDHLIRCSQGLTNYGTQLKILTSVKAASIEESKDTDESLSTIATDLGDILSQALRSMSISNTLIFKIK